MLWKRFTRKRSYLMILLGIWLAVVLSILGLYSVFWANVTDIYRSRTDEFEENYLTQTRNAIDITLGQLDASLRQLLADQQLKTFADYPRGRYYEELTGPMEDVNRTQLYYYLEAKTDLWALLANKNMSNDFIQSIYYYDASKDMFFTSSGLQYTRPSFPDVACISYIQQAVGNEVGWSIQSVRTDSALNSGKTLLTILYYHTRTGRPTNLIIVNLDVALLSRHIFSGLSWREDGGIYVMSDEGSVILGSNPETIGMDMDRLEDSAYFTVRNRGGQWTVTATGSDRVVRHIPSLLTDWHILSVALGSGVYQDIGRINLTLLLTAAVALALSTAMAFLVVRRMYRPVHTIIERIEGGDCMKSPAVDEFEEIIGFVEQSRTRQATLQQRLTLSMPAYRETVLRGLLQGRTIHSEHMEQVMETVDMPVDREPVIVVAEAGAPLDESDIQALCASLGDRFARDALIPMDGRLVLLMNVPPERQPALRDMLREMGREQRIRFGIAPAAPLTRIAEAYQQALFAVHALTTRDQYGCLGFEEVHEDAHMINLMLEDRLGMLERTLRDGDVDQAVILFDAIADKLERNLAAMSIFQVRHEMMKVSTAIFNAMPRYLLDDELGMVYRQTMEVLGGGSFTAMKQALRGLLSGPMKNSAGLSDANSDDYVVRARHMVLRDYSRDLSLQDAAAAAGITPEYLSLLFKKKTGQSFVEYLTDVRLHKAKELLQDGENKVRDVARMVGYQNTDYFIRVFKRYAGVTPGRYQRQSGRERQPAGG